MTTEQTDQAPAGVAIVHPITGEVLDLTNTTTDRLAEALEDVSVLIGQVIDVRQGLSDELARRLDTVNTRSEQVGDWVIEVNAGTEEAYQPPATREALEPLVSEGILDAEAISRIITWRPGSAGTWAVDKREVNKLKRHPNPAVQQALAKARVINPVKRKVKVAKVVRAALQEGPDA